MSSKRYIHDRLVLLLLTISLFFTILISVLILLALSSGTSAVYTIEHRPSLGLSANKAGTALQMSSFVVFVFLVLIFHTFLSIRVYSKRRNFAIVILAMGVMLIIMAGIISYFLLQK